MPLFGSKKPDAIVVGVRYKRTGEVEWVRAYERRGATWSDWKLIPRADLIERLKSGQRFVVGDRIEYMAGTFKTDKPVQLVEANGGDRIVVSDKSAESGDPLEGVPLV